MISSELSLQIELFRRMAEETVAIMEMMAVQAQAAGAKLSQNLYGPSGARVANMSAQTGAAMSKVAASTNAASAAMSQAGQKAGSAARGFQATTASANQASGATVTFGQRLTSVFNRAGAIGHTITGIAGGVRTLNEVLQRFRTARAPVQAVTSAMNEQGKAASGAAAKNKVTATSLLQVLKVSTATALAVISVAKAYKELKAWKPPPVPPLPKVSKLGSQAGPSIRQSILSSRGPIAVAIAGLAALVGASFAAIKVGEILKASIQQAAHAETLQVSLSVLVGGADRAKSVIEDLTKRAERTPYTGTDYTQAGRALIAFGETADSVGDALDRISDISAGIGASSAGFGEIAEIYGKARVQGQLFAEDINQLTGRGIPVIGQLAAILGVTEAEVKKLGSEGKINFGHLEQAFINLTSQGGKFFGMSARLSQTTAGLWTQLNGRVQQLMKELGKPINDALRPLLSESIELASALKERAKQVGEAIGNAVRFGMAAFQDLGTSGVLTLLRDGLILAFKEATNFLYGALMGVLAGLGTVVGASLRVAGTTFNADFWKGMLYGLASFGTSLRAVLMRAGAEFVRAIADSGVLGKSLVGEFTATDMTIKAAELESTAKIQMEAAGQHLASFGEQAGAAIMDIIQNVGPKVVEGFKRTEGIFDTSEDRGKMVEAIAKIQAVVERNRAAQEKKESEEAPPGPPGEQTPVAEPPSRVRMPGMFASAVNLIMGRSPYELQLDEARKHTQLLEKIDKNTQQRPPAAKPAEVKPAKPVDMTPRFA